MKELMSVRMVENDEGEIDLLIDPDDAATGLHVDQLLRCLAAVRPQMQPAVPTAEPQGEVQVAPLGRWYVGDSFPHGTVLGLRHPAYGWLAYQLPADFLEDLRANLQKLEDAKALRPIGRPQ